MLFHVMLEQAEDGWIVAECPALPGCVSQGKDEAAALQNIKEATIAWLWAEDQKALIGLTRVQGQQPNEQLMEFLDRRASDPRRIPLADAKVMLGLDTKTAVS
jgi:predicted RNase H-like HicB family nuclease